MLFACNDPMAFPYYPCYLKFLPPAWPLYSVLASCNVYPCLEPVPAMFTPAWNLYLQCLPLPDPCTCNVYPCLALVPAMFTPAWPLSLQCLPLPGPCTCNVYPCLLVRRLEVTWLTKSIAQFNLIIWTMNLKISYGQIHPFM